MQLRCPNCAAPIMARQINVDKLVAVCEQCSAVFSVQPETLPTSAPKRRKVLQPEKLEVTEGDNTLEISYLFRDHLGWLEVVMLFFTGLITAGTLIGIGVTLSEGQWLPFVLLSAFILLPLYLLVSSFTNRYVVTLGADKLIARDGPLRSYILDAELDRDDIVRVFAKRGNVDDKPNDDYYHVVAQTTDQSEVKILHYVRRTNAEFIAQMLDEYIQSDHYPANHFLPDDVFHAAADEAALNEGEIIADDVADHESVSLDDLLQAEQETKRHRKHGR